jgi:hypothetical protein
MRLPLYLFVISAFIFGFSKYAILAEYELTPAQKHFTAIIKGLPGVTNAQWKSPISLWVQASAKAVGSPPNSAKAKQLADILADRGRTALRQPFCIHIYQGSTNDLARSCVY